MTDANQVANPPTRRSLFVFRKSEDRYASGAFTVAKAIADAVFKLASWCMLLGVLKYLSDKSGSVYLNVTYILLNGALIAFIYTASTTFELDIVPAAKRTTWLRKLLDFGVNTLLAMAIYTGCLIAVSKLVEALSSLQGLK